MNIFGRKTVGKKTCRGNSIYWNRKKKEEITKNVRFFRKKNFEWKWKRTYNEI